MKKNRLILLVVLILAVVAILLFITRKDITFRSSLSDFAVADTAAVTKIFMADKNNNTVTLTRQPNGQWMVNDTWPASKFNMDMLLQTMLNLAVKEPVSQAAHNNIVRELAVNSVKVEIYQRVYRIDLFSIIRWFPHEKLTKVYYVGGATQSNRGSYMLMENSPTPFVIYLPGFRGFVSPRYTPMVNAWRDYTIFRKEFPEIARVQVEIPIRENESFVITDNRNRSVSLYTFPEMEPIGGFDTLAALNFLTGFRNLNFEGILNEMNPAEKDSILASTPFIIITLTDTAGVSRTLRAFFKKGYGEEDINGNPIRYDRDRFYASINEGKDFVLVQYFSFDRVLRPRSFFFRDQPVK
ncbi:MAG: hypothetical protein D4R67_05820 [Bacteroidetes bacterium]|nr:MAG: hypothetical protein D4R67_05820 [Bacteroidota bacterium]